MINKDSAIGTAEGERGCWSLWGGGGPDSGRNRPIENDGDRLEERPLDNIPDKELPVVR